MSTYDVDEDELDALSLINPHTQNSDDDFIVLSVLSAAENSLIVNYLEAAAIDWSQIDELEERLQHDLQQCQIFAIDTLYSTSLLGKPQSEDAAATTAAVNSRDSRSGLSATVTSISSATVSAKLDTMLDSIAEIHGWMDVQQSELSVMRDGIQTIELQNLTLDVQNMNCKRLHDTITQMLQQTRISDEEAEILVACDLAGDAAAVLHAAQRLQLVLSSDSLTDRRLNTLTVVQQQRQLQFATRDQFTQRACLAFKQMFEQAAKLKCGSLALTTAEGVAMTGLPSHNNFHKATIKHQPLLTIIGSISSNSYALIRTHYVNLITPFYLSEWRSFFDLPRKQVIAIMGAQTQAAASSTPTAAAAAVVASSFTTFSAYLAVHAHSNSSTSKQASQLAAARQAASNKGSTRPSTLATAFASLLSSLQTVFDAEAVYCQAMFKLSHETGVTPAAAAAATAAAAAATATAATLAINSKENSKKEVSMTRSLLSKQGSRTHNNTSSHNVNDDAQRDSSSSCSNSYVDSDDDEIEADPDRFAGNALIKRNNKLNNSSNNNSSSEGVMSTSTMQLPTALIIHTTVSTRRMLPVLFASVTNELQNMCNFCTASHPFSALQLLNACRSVQLALTAAPQPLHTHTYLLHVVQHMQSYIHSLFHAYVQTQVDWIVRQGSISTSSTAAAPVPVSSSSGGNKHAGVLPAITAVPAFIESVLMYSRSSEDSFMEITAAETAAIAAPVVMPGGAAAVGASPSAPVSGHKKMFHLCFRRIMDAVFMLLTTVGNSDSKYLNIVFVENLDHILRFTARQQLYQFMKNKSNRDGIESNSSNIIISPVVLTALQAVMQQVTYAYNTHAVKYVEWSVRYELPVLTDLCSRIDTQLKTTVALDLQYITGLSRVEVKAALQKQCTARQLHKHVGVMHKRIVKHLPLNTDLRAVLWQQCGDTVAKMLAHLTTIVRSCYEALKEEPIATEKEIRAVFDSYERFEDDY